MASGRQKTVFIRPSRVSPSTKVVVLSPSDFSVIIAEDTDANIAAALVARHGNTSDFYLQWIQRARELRGIELSVGDAVVSFPAQPLG